MMLSLQLGIESNRELKWTDFKGEVLLFFQDRGHYLSTSEFPLKKPEGGGGVGASTYLV